MFDAFISYSSKDKKIVRELMEKLRAEGLHIWLDEERVMGGDQIVGKIEEGLNKSRRVVLVLSPAVINSRWVPVEWNAALHAEIQGGTTRLIPVQFEALDDSGIPFLLRSKKRIDLSQPEGFTQLVKAILPLSLETYKDWVRRQPLVEGRLFNTQYYVEPADLLRVALREVSFPSSEPYRAIRTNQEPITLVELVRELTAAEPVNPTSAVVLLGEAGVGKTTSSKLLRRLLLDVEAAQPAVPFYVPLGAYRPGADASAMLNPFVGVGAFHELLQAVVDAGHHLIVLLDGANEQPPDTLRPLFAFVRQLTRRQHPRISVVITSRPIISADSVWQDDGVRFFELRRWTREQLESYLQQNGWEPLLSQIPDDVINCLRLPLIASLVVRQLNADEPLASLRTVSQVFERLINQFLMRGEDPRGQCLPREPENPAGSLRRYIEELAYRMTRDQVVQTEGREFESVLMAEDKHLFKPLLSRLVNSGLLRCSNATVALEPSASPDELLALSIGFLHQAFQEYLTALRVCSDSSLGLPPDVSHNAFWREVPIYIIHNRPTSAEQKEFALGFLHGAADYLTAARLSGEIADPGLRRGVEERVCQELLGNIRRQGLYPYAIEAFLALGSRGREGLRSCLREPERLRRVFAKFEAHLVDKPVTEADEEGWRPLGRSVYLLGEMGDFWLAEHLVDHLEDICSLHLLYHIGEALLTLARMPTQSEEALRVIQQTGKRLGELERRDPVTRGYSDTIVRTCGGTTADQGRLAAELKEFLQSQMIVGRDHFGDEFWQRAHGVESFAEIASASDGVEVLTSLFETEDRADYIGHEEVGYKPVQSSIVKAMLRLCDSSQTGSNDWHPLLEAIFMSPRIADNGWACRHLERLLLKWFSGPDDIRWVKSWRASNSTGGPRINSVLSNVIWFSS